MGGRILLNLCCYYIHPRLFRYSYLGGACWSAVGLWLDETGEAHFQQEHQEET